MTGFADVHASLNPELGQTEGEFALKLLERKLATRFEGRVSFKQPLEVRRLSSEFDEAWERSTIDPELRRPHL